MSTITNSPDPCLVAILLVCNTRSGSGAQLLYNYPHNPTPDQFDSSASQSEEDDSEDDSSSDSAFSSPDGEEESNRDVSAQSGAGISSRPDTRRGNEQAASNTIFDLDEDGLVGLLTPDRSWHKRKFELGVNDLTFVAPPVFVRNSGFWPRRRRKKQKTAESADDTSASPSPSEGEALERSHPPNDPNDPSKEPTKNGLTMFHVVFVLNPPPLEHVTRVKDMYDHVIRKLARALKWEQIHNDLVWKQTELILSVKAKRQSKSQMLTDILAKSSLATAISSIYQAISKSRIALVTLSPQVTISLQIPPITSAARLPSLTEPPIQPGLWLTTSTDIASTTLDEDYAAPSATQLAKHYTLLLKTAPQRIAKDAVEAGGPLAHTLPKFLSSLRPTKSFYKLQLATQMKARDIQVLAQHLIDWRRAIAIPPLYQGDTYIVSPNADMRKLYDAIKAYEREFPLTMPSLPKMLAALSGKPRPYSSLIPSSDHKEIYFLALAWLMRHGWVTQLRTFTCIRVSPEVKRAVRGLDKDSRSRPSNSHEEVREQIRPANQRPSISSRVSSEGRKSMSTRAWVRSEKMSSLILNPPRASPIESRWLAHISDHLTDDELMHLNLTLEEKAELRRYWPLFVKYFNGRVALQTIPVRESLKRKFVWALLDKLGVNQFGRIEDEDGKNQRLLVTVRHW